MEERVRIQQERRPGTAPVTVSFILLDWSVREHYHALEWLADQDVPRDSYELIWVELYERVVPKAMEFADVVITCGQRGMYHKHVGYNAGLLHARGRVITVCDSDAVFPPDFVRSIIESFELQQSEEGRSLVLMHYQWRTRDTYPEKLESIEDLRNHKWHDLWPNVGACMSVRRIDALPFGGFDEHRSFRGYLCGPYDLGWRLVNAGIPEVWHDPSVALWHFAHPDPVASFRQRFSWKLWREVRHPHVDCHALTAVEAFSTGRLLPLKENGEIHRLRMKMRQIGTPFEEKYASMAGREGFSRLYLLRRHLSLLLHPMVRLYRKWFRKKNLRRLRAKIGLRTRLKSLLGIGDSANS